jgi:hypothetical protein
MGYKKQIIQRKMEIQKDEKRRVRERERQKKDE